jgi:putative transposase
MQTYESLKHTTWECKYHVVFIPKCRRKVLYGQLRQELGDGVPGVGGAVGMKAEEGHLMPDHVHMLFVPPKYSVSQVMGFIKGKSAIHIARVYARDGGTLWGSIFGHGVIGCQRSARTRLPCVATSKSRKKKTNASNNWNWWRFERLTITNNRFERFTLSQASGFAGGR